MKKRLILILCLLGLFCILLIFNFSALKISYYKLSKKNGVVTKIVKGKRIDYEYRAGCLYGEQTIINGEVQEWAYRYYRNGAVERKVYVNNTTNYYKEFAYSSSGDIQYIGGYFHLKKYGSWNFIKAGKLDRYEAFDVDAEPYFTATYDTKGNPINQKGLVISEKFFSIDKEKNIFKLEQATIDHSIGIKDLHITVAIPRNTKLYISATINGVNYKFDKIINNTVIIKDIFLKRGIYEIFIESHLFDRNNIIVNGINMKRKITII